MKGSILKTKNVLSYNQRMYCHCLSDIIDLNLVIRVAFVFAV